jgi:glycine/serine hydroxymethyltransferase
MGVKEMEEIAGRVMDVLKAKGEAAAVGRAKAKVLALTARFPLPA